MKLEIPENLTSEDGYGMMAVARIKKPHRHFGVGDLVVGNRSNGCADNLQCWGWSSKHRRIVGGRWGYYIYYCGWERTPRRHVRAAKNAMMPDPSKFSHTVPNGRGYLRILKWIEGKCINREYPFQLRDEAWLRRLLLEISCGNVPLTREEATPSDRFPFLKR